MRRLLRRLAGDSRGTAMIEFAFLAPALFVFVLGIVEGGRMFYVRQSLEYATQQAARYYMVNPAAAQSDVTTALRNAMAGGMGVDIPTPLYEDATPCNNNANVTCTKITATYNFVSVVNFLGWGTVQMSAVAQAVRLQ